MNPFELTAAPFLELYASLFVLCVIVGLLLRRPEDGGGLADLVGVASLPRQPHRVQLRQFVPLRQPTAPTAPVTPPTSPCLRLRYYPQLWAGRASRGVLRHGGVPPWRVRGASAL